MSQTSTNRFYNHSFQTRQQSSLIEIDINKNYNNLINSIEKSTEFCPLFVQGFSRRANGDQRNTNNIKEQSEDKIVFKYNFKFKNKLQPILRRNLNALFNLNIKETLSRKQTNKQFQFNKDPVHINNNIYSNRNNNSCVPENQHKQIIPSLSITNYKINHLNSYNDGTTLTPKHSTTPDSKIKQINYNIENINQSKKRIINGLKPFEIPTLLLKDKHSFIDKKVTPQYLKENNGGQDKLETFSQYKSSTILMESNTTRNLPLIKPLINGTSNTFEGTLKEKKTPVPPFSAGIQDKIKNLLYEPSPPDYYSNDYYYYIIHSENCGNLIKQCMTHRLKWKECHSILSEKFNFKWKGCSTGIRFCDLEDPTITKQIVNHYEYHSSLSNKAKLFKNLFLYCETINQEVFSYLPFTIIIDLNNQISHCTYLEGFKTLFTNINDYIFKFSSIFHKIFSRNKKNYTFLFPFEGNKSGLKTNLVIPHTHFNGKNYWIVKAPNLNRGRGMQIFNSVQGVMKFIKSLSIGECKVYSNNDKYHSSIVIIQKYIEKPLLYKKRKFDIRLWVLLTHKMDVFVFKEGHLKACSEEYNENNIQDHFIHFTNYSLQKHCKNFSKYEKGNEINFETFQKFLGNEVNINEEIFPKFKEIIELTMRSVKYKINENNKKYCFEIFGYDFMMDEEHNVFLIEVNTNPGLEESSELIKELIPRMVEDALILTLDDVFKTTYSKEWVDQNGKYKSNFHVKGYDDSENMWEFVCDLNGHHILSNRKEKEIISPKNKKKKINFNKIRKTSKK